MLENKLPILIFVHYFGGHAGSWKWIEKRISKKHKCVFLNLPGFGNTKPLDHISIRSMSEWIANEIKILETDNYILIGHSMGGKLALFTTFILHDLLPKKIVLIAPSSPSGEDLSDSDKTQFLNDLVDDKVEETIHRLIKKKLNKNKLKHTLQSQLSVDRRTTQWWFNKGIANNITWAIKNLDVPIYLISSKNDPIITSDVIQKNVLPYLKKPILITFGRSGHLIPIESPRKLTRVIKKIVSE